MFLMLGSHIPCSATNKFWPIMGDPKIYFNRLDYGSIACLFRSAFNRFVFSMDDQSLTHLHGDGAVVPIRVLAFSLY